MYLSHHDIFDKSWKYIGVHVKGGGVNTQEVIRSLDSQGIGVWERPDRLDLYKGS